MPPKGTFCVPYFRKFSLIVRVEMPLATQLDRRMTPSFQGYLSTIPLKNSLLLVPLSQIISDLSYRVLSLMMMQPPKPQCSSLSRGKK